MNKDKGLYGKYLIQHADGHPMDPNAKYFVLRYDKDDQWGKVCRGLLWKLATEIISWLPELSADLKKEIEQIGIYQVFTNDVEWYVALDKEDLRQVYHQHYDCPMEENGENPEEWRTCDPNVVIGLTDTDGFFWSSPLPDNAIIEDLPPYEGEPQGKRISLPAKDWARLNGRGFLASTEY